MTTLPGIIQQRWAAACESPSLPQWRSMAEWLAEFAIICEAHPETAHMVDDLRLLAREALGHMLAMMPAREVA